MTRTKLILFFVIIAFLAVFTSMPKQAQAGLAGLDIEEYETSKHASSQWNDLVKQGIEAYHSETYDIAQNMLYKAFNKGCRSPIVVFMLATILEYQQSYYSSLEYYKMAQKGFKKSNKKHRFNRTFNENYGRALYNSGKKQEALPILRKAAKKSKSYWLFKLLGMLSYEQGDTLNALSYLERAVRVKSKEVTKAELIFVYGLLGKLFLHKGEQDGAHRYYQKVIDLDPNNPEAKKFMGVIQKQYQNQKMQEVMEHLKDS